MISYRHHVVSLVAVFLALAAGVAGRGPLSDLARDPATSSAGPACSARRPSGRHPSVTTSPPRGRPASRRPPQGPVRPDPHPAGGGRGRRVRPRRRSSGPGTVAGTYDASRCWSTPREVPGGHHGQPGACDHARRRRGERGRVDVPAARPADQARARGARRIAGDATSIRQSLAGADLPSLAADARRASLVLVVLGDDVDDAILSGLLAWPPKATWCVVVAGDAASGVDETCTRCARSRSPRTSPPSTASTSWSAR